jgi:hypothetical protein
VIAWGCRSRRPPSRRLNPSALSVTPNRMAKQLAFPTTTFCPSLYYEL